MAPADGDPADFSYQQAIRRTAVLAQHLSSANQVPNFSPSAATSHNVSECQNGVRQSLELARTSAFSEPGTASDPSAVTEGQYAASQPYASATGKPTKYARIHGEVSRKPAVWRTAAVPGPELEDVLYEKAEGEGIAKVGMTPFAS
jgi:hypothetical protein